ncbi:unnamed protein product [Caenorhabditis auriculariae]|uniref:Uncharacterized protein n=1 Tax=Caenorhabditis auriculariae TaxID=2777116 RepID=A0A8S1GV23_9PELO|nr:unnamed protein product [Caenorhabditis auriculariae]
MVVKPGTHQVFNIDHVKSKAVYNLITQLIHEVTNITETFPLEKGQTAEDLVLAVEKSTGRFLHFGDQAIATVPVTQENHHVIDDLRRALDAVQDTGQKMLETGRNFVRDSTSSQKRATAIGVGRQFLNAVAYFLIIADATDVQIIVEKLENVRDLMNSLAKAESKAEVEEIYRILTAQIEDLDITIRKRIADLIEQSQKDNLLAARSVLRCTAPLVYASTKAYVRHPEQDESRRNRDYSHREMLDALDLMARMLRGEEPEGSFASHGRIGDLVNEIDLFQMRVEMDPQSYRREVHRPELEELAERIVSGSAAIADADSTRESRKQKIVAECNNLRQALQELLTEYEKSRGRYDENDDIPLGIAEVHRKAKDLRRHLRRAVVDHISDAFLDTKTPLMLLIEVAKCGDPEDTQHKAHLFRQHASKLIAVSRLACKMSSDTEGVSVILHTAEQLEKLAPEVVNAAYLLCARPDSKTAQENMEAFRKLWFDRVNLLTMAIDGITTLDDFLAVSEAHIVEDCNEGIQGITAHASSPEMNLKNCQRVDCAAGAIRGRALRVCAVVDAEMDFLQPSEYTENAKNAVRILRDNRVMEFSARAGDLVDRQQAMGLGWDATQKDEEMNEFINACTLVHEAVKGIRNALLMNRNMQDVDSDNEYEEDGQTAADTMSKISDQENQQRLMRRLPEEDKKKIQAQIDIFKVAQTRFEKEVAKWDETGNDIIVLAKHMCMIMMNMTDFTRGCGPLKTTMDVIRSAQEISVAGSKLNALAKQIGDESVDSQSKNDLMAYLSQITLYCQQLNICSKVKADVQQVGNELVVSGLDSAMSLIQTARNLLGAVVQTVKAAYIASTKFRRANSSSVRVEWRMAPPRKQPLVRPQKNNAIIRRASERRPLPPAKALAEFTMRR